MARYIDLEELEKRIKKYVKPEIPEEKAFVEYYKDECIRQGYAMPTADVVPRAEAENYKSIAETQQKLSMDRYFEIKQLKSDIERLQAEKDALIKNYAECMKDYARKIFEEIEYNFEDLRKVEHANAPLQIVFNLLDYLKKKYTVGDNEN